MSAAINTSKGEKQNPRLRRPNESLDDYRMAMGWAVSKPAQLSCSIKVEFEETFNQGEITKLAAMHKVNAIGMDCADPQACFDQVYGFFSHFPHYVCYRGHNHVAVHMKQPNGMPQPVRQFLISENTGADHVRR